MNPAPFLLRPAVEADSRPIQLLIRQSGINPIGLDWRRFTLAVDAHNAMIGCVQIKSHSDGTHELASLAVVPEWRGRGVARVLIETLLQREPRPLYLTCRAGLGPFYQRFGFRSLSASELPPYFRRIRRLANVLIAMRFFEEDLLVMVCEESG